VCCCSINDGKWGYIVCVAVLLTVGNGGIILCVLLFYFCVECNSLFHTVVGLLDSI